MATNRCILGFVLMSLSVFVLSRANAQDSLNMQKLAGWTSDSAAGCSAGGKEYNDLWGYEANGREYAILGSCWGTHFVDITNPGNPVEISSFKGRYANTVWRDFKTYQHYAYGVGDGGGHSLQIFDLQYLPDSVIKVYDEDSLTRSAHSIFIENGRAYLSSNIRGASPAVALEILDLTNPIAPVADTTYGNDMFGNCSVCLHDTYVRNDTAYCSAGTEGMFIYDLRDTRNPSLISVISFYSDKGYNHSSWMTPDGNYLVSADEVPTGLRLKLFDIADLQNINEVAAFESNPLATPHNPFIRGNEVYVSYYMDGVQVFDIQNPSSPVRTAFYDTYPDNDSTYSGGAYRGCWGVFPYFSSRNVIASDRTYGLFVLGKINDVFISKANDSICQNETLMVEYSAVGTYDSTNQFILQMTGDQDFNNATIIGTNASDSSGSIAVNISGLVAPGTYRIRMKASDPYALEGTYSVLEVLESPAKATILHATFGKLELTGVDTTIHNVFWYFQDSVLAGTGGYYNLPTNLSGATGFYHAVVESPDGCQTATDPIEIVMGIPELNTKGFTLYPNPSEGMVGIRTDAVRSFTFFVQNSMGQNILIGESNTGTTQFDLSHLKRGIYFVQIRTKETTFTQKLILR